MTQLYAMIKMSSKHYNQRIYNTDGDGNPIPFKVTIDPNEDESQFGAVLGGVGGNYHFDELSFYVEHNGTFKRL